MKYKITIIIISLITILLILYMFVLRCNRKLPELSNYNIVSNTGTIIPAKLYSRIVKSNIDGNEKIINEFILCFNDALISNKLNVSGDEKLYKYLVIVPDLKVIGLVNHAKSLKEKDIYICQTDDKADSFTSMINNRTFYSNPPIKEASFTREKIVFNTYGILKQFGDSIIIEIGNKNVR
ncbi:hypothetical protein N4T20_09445 [Flavobacterium sp. TR2]|uniref:hypothetical protein n=1 Tax=Flavobacterium sp. TR2 TaxID=2977321 RepID=UPI0021B0DB8F|nr:hypothetical protein [Flavobacterium sp. TR2]UWY30148.1 hypothetical protein N4T20_09445 [Flavobacterium sp. TR2]